MWIGSKDRETERGEGEEVGDVGQGGVAEAEAEGGRVTGRCEVTRGGVSLEEGSFPELHCAMRCYMACFVISGYSALHTRECGTIQRVQFTQNNARVPAVSRAGGQHIASSMSDEVVRPIVLPQIPKKKRIAAGHCTVRAYRHAL